MLAKKWFGQVGFCWVLTALVLTGCNKPSIAQADGNSENPPKPTAVIQDENRAGETTAKALSEQVMSTMGSAFLAANQMAKATKGKEQFTQEQISCFTSTANDKLQKNLQQHLTKIFNADEIKKLDDYYASQAGKKQIAMTKAMIDDLMNGDNKTDNGVQPTEEERAEMQFFWQSKVGQKLANALQDKNALAEPLTDVVSEKESVCKMPKP